MSSARALPWVAAALYALYSLLSLHLLLEEQTFPHAEGWISPLGLGWSALLAAITIGALVRRAGAASAAFALGACALGLAATRDLPDFASGFRAGDGPALSWLQLVLAAAGALLALVRLGRWSAAERHAMLLVLWTTANLRVYFRDNQAVYGLFALGVVLQLVAHGGGFDLRALLRGHARRGAVLVGCFLGWWFVAALAGDSLRMGLDQWSRLFVGALFAWSLAGSLGPSGAARATRALLYGALVGLAALIVTNLEMRGWVEPERHLRWRMRLFDQHPNQIAPFFASGVCVCLALALGARALSRRLVFMLLGLACALALAWTRSRSGLVGLALALPCTWLALRGRLPARPLPWAAAALSLTLVGVGVLLSPAGSGLRARLDAAAQGPSAIGQRWHFWKMAAATLEESPLLGAGPGQFYAHARLAEPSYYDGTAQDLHSHNLVLALGEGAGYPGMLLGVLVFALVLELGRRRLLASEGEQRVWGAALLGALLAVLGSNLLDLGQSQGTLLPMLAWAALGLFAARGTSESRASAPGALAGAGALLLVALLSLRPMLSDMLAGLGRAALFAQRSEFAESCYHWADRIDPLAERPRHALTGIYRSRGQQRLLRENLRALADSVPSRARARLSYARELMRQGRADEGLVALERVLELDPRGPALDDVAFYRAWAHLLRGEEPEARAQLIEGMRNPGGSWSMLPQFDAPLRPGDPRDARRIHFDLGGGRGIALTEVLQVVAEESLALLDTDPITSRRRLGRVVEGYRTQGLLADALEWLDIYRERAGAGILPSLEVLQLNCLSDSGELERGLELYSASVSKGDPHFTEPLIRGLLSEPTPERIATASQLERDTEDSPYTTKFKDLFFLAGGHREIYEGRALLALHRGEYERALHMQRCAVFDISDPSASSTSVSGFLQQQAGVAFDRDCLLGTLELLLSTAGRSRKVAKDVGRMRGWARVLLEALPEDGSLQITELGPIIAESGRAGQSFARALQLERGAGGAAGPRRRSR